MCIIISGAGTHISFYYRHTFKLCGLRELKTYSLKPHGLKAHLYKKKYIEDSSIREELYIYNNNKKTKAPFGTTF